MTVKISDGQCPESETQVIEGVKKEGLSEM